jgi:nitrite reductase/ring-hydroxylating ferredoxin subunit
VNIEKHERFFTESTRYLDPGECLRFLRERQPTPLFERVAETNFAMARRLGIGEVERALRDIARDSWARYRRILLGDAALAASEAAEGADVRLPAAPRCAPTPATAQPDGAWALARITALPPQTPRRFVAAGVELVAIRTAEAVHVLEGRCPHRRAPLSDAIVDGERLVCPHHGWDFRLDTGRSDGVPDAAVQRFHAFVRDGQVRVDGAELEAWQRTHAEPWHDDDVIL